MCFEKQFLCLNEQGAVKGMVTDWNHLADTKFMKKRESDTQKRLHQN